MNASSTDLDTLLAATRGLDPKSAAEQLDDINDREIADLLGRLPIGHAVEILEEFNPARRTSIAAQTPFGEGQRWLESHNYPEGTVGRLLETPPAVFSAETTIATAIEALREIVKRRLVIYVLVTERDGRLVGVVAFRELVFGGPRQTLGEVMVREPFFLRPEQPLLEAMEEVVTRHYPVYPVCDESSRLLGLVKGQTLFEQQAFEISAQAGAMVGVEKEERLATPWPRSFRSRHPWLQLNLLTVFVAAAVVGFFQDTIDRLVVLAMFLPVLSGQSGNLGSQTLAVTLRGMTLGELKAQRQRLLVSKEAWLGLLNGAITGAVAALAMYVVAARQPGTNAALLAAVTLAAMTASCILSGIAGATIPLLLKRVGADPATASTIFLTTATDVFSMGSFLGLAAWLVH